MSDQIASNEDLKYFYSEIAEEGELNIAFGYLCREHGWTYEKYEKFVRDAIDRGLCHLERWGDEIEAFEVQPDEIDFSSEESMKSTSFVPTDIAWDAYNRLL